MREGERSDQTACPNRPFVNRLHLWLLMQQSPNFGRLQVPKFCQRFNISSPCMKRREAARLLIRLDLFSIGCVSGCQSRKSHSLPSSSSLLLGVAGLQGLTFCQRRGPRSVCKVAVESSKAACAEGCFLNRLHLGVPAQKVSQLPSVTMPTSSSYTLPKMRPVKCMQDIGRKVTRLWPD